MKHIQTQPIAADQEFLDLASQVNESLARYGFCRLLYKGSVSWTAGKFDLQRTTETFYKLLYRGKHRTFLFGGRLDFYSSIPKLSEIVWPEVFSVMPSVSVHFGGFEVSREEFPTAIQRIAKILSCLPEPQPSQAVSQERKPLLDLDMQLEAL